MAESVLPALGLRMDGRARVKRLVRGGIIADQVAGGLTTLCCVQLNFKLLDPEVINTEVMTLKFSKMLKLS